MCVLEHHGAGPVVVRFTEHEALDHAAVGGALELACCAAAPGEAVALDLARARVDHAALAELVGRLRATGVRVELRGASEEHLRVLRYLGIEVSGAPARGG